MATASVAGLRECREAFKRVPLVMQRHYNVATRQTAEAILAAAKNNLYPGHGYDTGQLQKALGVSMSEKTGVAKVGIRRGFDIAIPGRGGSALKSAGARHHRPTAIGHLVEFGHGGPAPAPAKPFMLPAALGQQHAYLQRIRLAAQAGARELVGAAARVRGTERTE